MYKKIVTAINKLVGILVYIAEFSILQVKWEVHMPDGQKPSRASHIMNEGQAANLINRFNYHMFKPRANTTFLLFFYKVNIMKRFFNPKEIRTLFSYTSL